MAIHPTAHRVTLLQDVADREVWQRSGGVSWRKRTEQPFDDRGPDERCTGRIEEAERAGWVWLNVLPSGSKRWDLTEAGRALLAASTPPPVDIPWHVLTRSLANAFSADELRQLAEGIDLPGTEGESPAWDRLLAALVEAQKVS